MECLRAVMPRIWAATFCQAPFVQVLRTTLGMMRPATRRRHKRCRGAWLSSRLFSSSVDRLPRSHEHLERALGDHVVLVLATFRPVLHLLLKRVHVEAQSHDDCRD